MDVEPLLKELSRFRELAPFRSLAEPLLAYDRERRSALVLTLRVYFAAGPTRARRPLGSSCIVTAYFIGSYASKG